MDRICTPAGLRAAPGREDTCAFVDGLTSLDGEAVARLLQHKLVCEWVMVGGCPPRGDVTK